MGFFDSKWTVEFEYSDGFLSSYKKATIVVEASSEYDAKSKANSILKPQHKYFHILKIFKSDGSKGTYKTKENLYRPSYEYKDTSSEIDELERERTRLEEERRKLERERERLERERWHNSLSPEERKAEDERVNKEREELDAYYAQAESTNYSIESKPKKPHYTYWQFILFLANVVFVPGLFIGTCMITEPALTDKYKDELWIMFDVVPAIFCWIAFAISLFLTILFFVLWRKRCKKRRQIEIVTIFGSKIA